MPPAESCGDRDDDDCDGAVDEGCPVCAPMAGVCPAGWTYSSDGSVHRCELTFTPPPGVRPYCLYSGMGYLGFHWQTPPAPPAYTCPPGARYALAVPSTGYCLWEGLTIPAGATIECPVTSGRMSFRWPCS